MLNFMIRPQYDLLSTGRKNMFLLGWNRKHCGGPTGVCCSLPRPLCDLYADYMSFGDTELAGEIAASRIQAVDAIDAPVHDEPIITVQEDSTTNITNNITNEIFTVVSSSPNVYNLRMKDIDVLRRLNPEIEHSGLLCGTSNAWLPETESCWMTTSTAGLTNLAES